MLRIGDSYVYNIVYSFLTIYIIRLIPLNTLNMIRFGCVQPLEQRVKQYALLNKYQLRKALKDLTKYLILNPLMRGCLDQK